MIPVEIVTALALLQYLVFGVLVGQARGKYGVRAPAVSGHEQFERVYRVQMNTLEVLIIFLPALWLAARYWSPLLVAGIGVGLSARTRDLSARLYPRSREPVAGFYAEHGTGLRAAAGRPDRRGARCLQMSSRAGSWRIRRDFPQTATGNECQDCGATVNLWLNRRNPMNEITRVGVDLAKRVIQVHAVSADGRIVTTRALARDKFVPWCAQLPRGCVVAMETCSGAHYWARKLCSLGLDARLIAGQFVGPYRMGGRSAKNDAADAAAICEAASRPTMRFVPIKSIAQQGVLTLHRLREGYKEERTACINRLRGLLAEFGLVFPQSPQALRDALHDVLEDASNELPGLARVALNRAYQHWIELDCHIVWCDERIAEHVRQDRRARAAEQLCGIGPVTASAIVASVGEFKQFRSAAQFGAWLGLVPRQNSSGGKSSLGRITKRGDDYLRTLLIQGAKSAVMTSQRRSDKISQWVTQLKERVGWQKAVVALANKNARILWAILTRETRFDPDHVSIKPENTVLTPTPPCPA